MFDPPGFDFIRIVEVWDLPPVGYREDAESSHALDVCISYALMRQVKRPFSADDVLDDMSRNIKYVFRSEKAVMTKKKREEERLVLSKNPIMKHLGKASEMLFVREPENSNPETFDFIHVACPLLGVKGDRRAFVEEHYDEIMQAVLWMIGKNRQFQKYGVSVNVLKASVCTVRGMDLMVIFELKEINNS